MGSSISVPGVIPPGSVDNVDLADMPANTVKARAASDAGEPGDLALSAERVLARLAAGDLVDATGIEVLNLVDSSVVWVTSSAQLPAPVSGVITLANGVYELLASVDITPNVVVGSGLTVLRGKNRWHSQLITDTTTNPDPTLPLVGNGIIEVDCLTLVNPGGRCVKQTITPGLVLALRSSFLANGEQDQVTDGTGTTAVVIDDCRWTTVLVGVVPVPCVGGLEMVGPFLAVGFNESGGAALTQVGGSMFTLTSASKIADQVRINAGLIYPQVGQTGITVTEVDPPTEHGVIRDCGFGPDGTPITGVESGTVGWTLDNPATQTSTNAGLINLTDNGATTVVTDGTSWHPITVDTPWVASAANERTELTDNPDPEDRLRMLGKVQHKYTIDGKVTINAAAGPTNQVFRVRVRLDRGGVLSTIGTPERITYSGITLEGTIKLLADLVLNDEIWLEVQSTGANDLNILDATLRAGSSS